jgi:hypothetical protein
MKTTATREQRESARYYAKEAVNVSMRQEEADAVNACADDSEGLDLANSELAAIRESVECLTESVGEVYRPEDSTTDLLDTISDHVDELAEATEQERLARVALTQMADHRDKWIEKCTSVYAQLAAYKAFADAAEVADSITYFVESKECLHGALGTLRAELERLKS